ncbi:MAG: NnrU family protein [Planctomycetota bacterium]|nr:NnrU family protein [Planctomycetota bacterium]
MRRYVGIAFGLGNHLLFAVTVVYLFLFLKRESQPLPSADCSLLVDFLLALMFAVPHSVLLLPKVRQQLTRVVPHAFYGSMFCVVTCMSLLMVFAGWQPSPPMLWQFTGVSRWLVQGAFLGSWVTLIYSLSLTGLGYQTGWTTWWCWFRRIPPPARGFNPRGAYLWLRHPVYLSFLGLIWFAPVMTTDRAVLTATWTIYIFFGSWLKDQRLIHYVGEDYARYQAKVPGYPGMFFGPLGRVPQIAAPASGPPVFERVEKQSIIRKAA